MYDALSFSLALARSIHSLHKQFSIDLCKLQNRKTKCKFVKHSTQQQKKNDYYMYSK